MSEIQAQVCILTLYIKIISNVMLQSNGYFILTFILSFRLPSLLMSLLRLNPNFLLPSPKSNLPSLLKLWRMKLLLTHLLLPPSRLLKPKLRLLSLTLKLLRLKPMLKLLLSRNNLLSRRLLPLLRSFSSLSPNKYFCLFHFFFFLSFFPYFFFFFFLFLSTRNYCSPFSSPFAYLVSQ